MASVFIVLVFLSSHRDAICGARECVSLTVSLPALQAVSHFSLCRNRACYTNSLAQDVSAGHGLKRGTFAEGWRQFRCRCVYTSVLMSSAVPGQLFLRLGHRVQATGSQQVWRETVPSLGPAHRVILSLEISASLAGEARISLL